MEVMENIPQKVMDAINPANRSPTNAQKLERIIVIRPAGTTEDIIDTLAYISANGEFKPDFFARLNQINEKEKQAARSLSNAFKRICLFEAAAYIAGTYTTELGDTELARTTVPELLRAQTSLMNEVDCTTAYRTITDAYARLKDQRKTSLGVSGKTDGVYLFDLKQVLKLCDPSEHQARMNTRFAGRSIRFATYDFGGYTVYQDEVDSNPEFAQFKKRWSHLFNPAVGRIVLQSPATVDYAAEFLDKFARRHQTVDPAKVRFSNGRALAEQFRIEDLYVE
jgi:hypothetical protein